MVDALDSKPSILRCAGSIPALGTIKTLYFKRVFLIITYFVYAISSLSRPYIYIGPTFNVIDRFQTHQKRLNATTKPYAPFLLIYTEECLDRKEARRREKYWKGGSGKRKLKLLKSKFM